MENDYNVSNEGNQYSTQMDPNKSVMTMGDWLITLLIMLVPCVNIIMMLVWAFGNGNENRKNFCRASLIMQVILSVLGFILYAIFASIFMAALGSY
jgi:glucan phosphoethanolaminetransferase (alkaline phosphatase superfamily)